jgi:hypothetical protein
VVKEKMEDKKEVKMMLMTVMLMMAKIEELIEIKMYKKEIK